jgi:hypothetical protein
MEAKLYSPVFVAFWEYDDYGSIDHYKSEHDQTYAVTWFDEIRTAILNERLPEETERGLMEYYYNNDTVNEKVQSLFVDIEIIGERLWAVSNITLTEHLTEAEHNLLCNYITGQFSDGFGEGFEQRDIKIYDGEINVHLWTHGDGFFINTQAQLSKNLGIILPEDALCQTIAPPTPSFETKPNRINEKPSALEEIRQAKAEARERQSAPIKKTKEISAQKKKSDQER